MLVRSSNAVGFLRDESPAAPPSAAVRFRIIFDAAPAGPGHEKEGGDALRQFTRREEVVVPIKTHLSCVTVAMLEEEFLKRMNRKFPELLQAWRVSGFLVRHVPDVRIMDLPSLEEPPMPQHAGFASKHAHTAPSRDGEVGFWRIDVDMNASDGLDDFFSAASSAKDAKMYELVVEWAERVGETAQRLSSSRRPEVAKASAGGQEEGERMSLAECIRLSEAKEEEKRRRNLFFPPAPPIALTQRCTYLDILHLRRSRREQDRANEYFRIMRERMGEVVSDEFSDEIEGGIVSRKSEAHHAARVALGEAEQLARTRIREEEEKIRRDLVEVSDERMKHLVTLATLQGNFLTNGKWVEMLRKHTKYPFDTLPIADFPTEEEKEHLRLHSDNAAVLGYYFKNSEEYLKEKRRREAAERERQWREAHVQFRDKIMDIVLEEKAKEKEARREQLRTEWFLEQGIDPVPPRTPSPPPTPRTPRMEELDGVYEELLETYLEFRHEIIAMERKDFRDMMGLMRRVLFQQSETDQAAVRLAYEEELRATNALDLDAYIDYDPLVLEEEKEYVEPWVLSQREKEVAEEEQRKQEEEGAQRHALAPADPLNVVRWETDEEFNARMEAQRFNPFRFHTEVNHEAHSKVATNTIKSIDESAGDMLEFRLATLRLTYKEKKNREAIFDEERAGWADLLTNGETQKDSN